MATDNKDNTAFLKAHESLRSSLQKHISKIFEVERAYLKCLTFADTYPFNPTLVEASKLEEYWVCRNSLKNLFTDETNQLDSLIKAIRQKDYEEEDKKHLFLLILGYMDIADSAFANLETYRHFSKEKDEELESTALRYDKLRKFVRLNIRGVMPKF